MAGISQGDSEKDLINSEKLQDITNVIKNSLFNIVEEVDVENFFNNFKKNNNVKTNNGNYIETEKTSDFNIVKTYNSNNKLIMEEKIRYETEGGDYSVTDPGSPLYKKVSFVSVYNDDGSLQSEKLFKDGKLYREKTYSDGNEIIKYSSGKMVTNFADGRVLTKEENGNTIVENDKENYKYTYDANNRLTSASNGETNCKIEYYDNGNVKSVSNISEDGGNIPLKGTESFITGTNTAAKSFTTTNYQVNLNSIEFDESGNVVNVTFDEESKVPISSYDSPLSEIYNFNLTSAVNRGVNITEIQSDLDALLHSGDSYLN